MKSIIKDGAADGEGTKDGVEDGVTDRVTGDATPTADALTNTVCKRPAGESLGASNTFELVSTFIRKLGNVDTCDRRFKPIANKILHGNEVYSVRKYYRMNITREIYGYLELWKFNSKL